MGVVCIGVVHISRHLKQELSWATDKWLQVNSNIILLLKTLRN